MLSKAFPILSIVVLLFPMGFFALASPPLLVLKHDTPLDGRFVRSTFNLYYLVVMSIAAFAAVGCAAVGHLSLAFAMGVVLAFVFSLRLWMVSGFDRLRAEIAAGAVKRFKRWHLAGMAVNVVQIAAVGWGLTRLAA